MYITLDNRSLKVTEMTKAFLNNALIRYEALCKDTHFMLEIQQQNKLIRDTIKAELKVRHRNRFKCLTD